jgi:hypothetical protein
MATILFEAGSVLGAACVRNGDPGIFRRVKLFAEDGREFPPSEEIGSRRLVLCDVRKIDANRALPEVTNYEGVPTARP